MLVCTLVLAMCLSDLNADDIACNYRAHRNTEIGKLVAINREDPPAGAG